MSPLAEPLMEKRYFFQQFGVFSATYEFCFCTY